MIANIRDEFDKLTMRSLVRAQEEEDPEKRSALLKDAKTLMEVQNEVDKTDIQLAEATEKSKDNKIRNIVTGVVGGLGAVATILAAVITSKGRSHDIRYQEDSHTDRQREYVKNEKEIVMSRALERP